VVITRALFLAYALTTATLQAQKTPLSSFERALQKLQQEKPALFLSSEKTDPSAQSKENNANDSSYGYTVIDKTCALYAIYSISHAYRDIYWISESQTAAHDSNIIYRSVAWLAQKSIPQPLFRLKQHTHFCALLISACATCIAYKTIAKAILYCWQADLFDVAKYTIRRTKELLS
jgi:hypothetical protein